MHIAIPLLALASFGTPDGGPPGTAPPARTLMVRGDAFTDPEVVTLKTLPPKFELLLRREMPTPGWSFVVDSVEVDEAKGRIVAKVSEIAPEGVTAQVITRTELRLPLGTLQARHHVLELYLRRGASGEHALVQAIVLASS
ncbi:MAG TPA: protease complex subunit PrcB family protein [Candidatus Polarisedimenticolaceae bacterium]|nr:protease complex subunit PrcB family protein [Candidatus Polarisedimenticolaceae bacterium]